MPIDQFTLSDLTIYEINNGLISPYIVVIQSNGKWRCGKGDTIRDAYNDFIHSRTIYDEKPGWLNVYD